MSCHNTTPRMAVLLYVLLAACHIAKADYKIFLNLRSAANPGNSTATGDCCDQSSCRQPCSVMLRFCFRDSQHPSNDFESSCALAQFDRTNARTATADLPIESAITGSYPGRFQVYIRVSHSDSDGPPTFSPPFTDDLIDNIIIETNLPSHLFEDRDSNNLQVQIHQQSGALAQVELGLAVYCAENFIGQDCNCRDTDDASGHFTCDRDGNKMCNTGYTDPATNCIQCIPADECSITGGFCVPGECRCVDGYSGDNCDIRDVSTSDTPITTTSTPATSDVSTGGLRTTDDDSVAIIAGSVAGAAALILIVVIIVVLAVAFVLARRKRRQGKWTPKGYQPTGLQQYPSVESEDSDMNIGVPLYATVKKPKKNLNDEAPPIPSFQGDNIMYSITTDRSENMYDTNEETIRSEKRKEGVVFENAGVPGAAVNDSEEPQEYEQVGFNTQQKKYADLDLPKDSPGKTGRISDVTYSEVEY